MGSRFFFGSSFRALSLSHLGCDSLGSTDVDDAFPLFLSVEYTPLGFHVRNGYIRFHMLESRWRMFVRSRFSLSLWLNDDVSFTKWNDGVLPLGSETVAFHGWKRLTYT